MKLSDFDYDLPADRIAQEPARPRDSARLFVHEIGRDETRHLSVSDLDDVLREGDLVVVNDTRVLPARLFGRRRTGGAVELLLLEPAGGGWRALARPARKLSPGEEVEIDGGLVARMIERDRGDGARGEPTWTVSLSDPRDTDAGVVELLERAGRIPLPPYIERGRGADPHDAEDRERYQTVYARAPGAVAAPTAGLHFTPELFQGLERVGVRRAELTLHVGLGTFQPVTADDTRDHRMHAERYELPVSTADAVSRCRSAGGRVVAVGTTSVRVLESRAEASGVVSPGAGETALFIEPGHTFRAVDALLTNFHLPRSTLLMLVSAFAGRDRVLRLYAEAVERGYRFYSYGDAMLLLP